MKHLLTKSDEPQAALLAYRSTPLENGYSPAEILMGRKLRTNLPVVPDKLIPKLPDLAKLRVTEAETKRKQAAQYNQRHRASNLSELETGETIYIPDYKENAVVINKTPQPRSYLVETDGGSVLRRNRNLTPDPNQKSPSPIKSPPPTAPVPELKAPPSTMEKTTRSGRKVVPPKRLGFESK